MTRLELAASCVTGKRSNQLNYTPECHFCWWAMQGLNLRLQPCKGCTLPTELIARKQRGYNNKQKWCQALNTLSLLFFPNKKMRRDSSHSTLQHTYISGIFVGNSKIQEYNYPIKSKAGHFSRFSYGASSHKE